MSYLGTAFLVAILCVSGHGTAIGQTKPCGTVEECAREAIAIAARMEKSNEITDKKLSDLRADISKLSDNLSELAKSARPYSKFCNLVLIGSKQELVTVPASWQPSDCLALKMAVYGNATGFDVVIGCLGEGSPKISMGGPNLALPPNNFCGW